MTPQDAAKEMRRLSELIDRGVMAITEAASAEAHAEHTYRKAKALSWLAAPAGTVPEREAWVNADTADERLERDLASGRHRAAWEALRSRRAQMSALQSLLAVHKAEAEFERTRP